MSNVLPMKIICVNDKNYPKEIPVEKRAVYGEIYTLIDAQHLLSSQSLGFVILELPLDESCFPYHYHNPNRFEPYDEKAMMSLDAELHEILNSPVA